MGNIFRNFLCLISTLLLIQACNHQRIVPDLDNGGLFMPDGFQALVVAVYVKLRSSNRDSGNVVLHDNNGDGKADTITRFGAYPKDGSLATEMRIHNGYLYYSSELAVYRQKLIPGEWVPTSPVETVLTDDHAHGSHWHITKPVAFDDKPVLIYQLLPEALLVHQEFILVLNGKFTEASGNFLQIKSD
jgi:hypothetical protein